MQKLIKTLVISFLLIVPAFGAINLPQPEPAKNPGFVLSHRFFGQLGQSDFLGLDSGANVGLGFDFKLRDDLGLTIQRFSFNQEYQLTGKLRLRDGVTAVFGSSYRGAAAIADNKLGFFGQLILSRQFLNDQLLVCFIPGLATATDLNNASAGENDTAALGLAVEYVKKIESGYLQEYSVVGDCNVPVAGYRLNNPGASIGLKLTTWGHEFTILVANSFSNSTSGYFPGTNSNSSYFGFNLVRRFVL